MPAKKSKRPPRKPAKRSTASAPSTAATAISQPPTEKVPQGQRSGDRSFPIVGIGASAGGLDAFRQFLAHLPHNIGMAFVLVQHLDPKHDSKLTELLSKSTRMPVAEVTDNSRVRPNHVYVIPPNTSMILRAGVLKLTPRGDTHLQHLPVDYLLKSLAQEQQSKAIGVILSGTGSDGAAGLAEIKGVGGITFAQDEASSKFSGMPLSAVERGCVDFILSPEAIARELTKIARHPYLASTPGPAATDPKPSIDDVPYRKILSMLRSTSGVDFTQYRDTTIKRRIMRRMVVHTTTGLTDYLRYLEDHPAEVKALYDDVLITVTSFFRDPEIFEALKRSVFPRIMKTKPSVIRVWVAGCSTGQEAYSLAIALLEFLENQPIRPSLQIFATDISDSRSLEKARAGVYPESIGSEVSSGRLRRFFTKEDGGYRITKSIRDMCVFAKQNVTTDPPFSRMDLISCRNVLIYLGQSLQRRVLSMFHYAVNPTGFLVLGASETVAGSSDLFGQMDRKHRIFSKKGMAVRTYPHFAADFEAGKGTRDNAKSQPVPPASDFLKEADRILLNKYAPVGVVVNGDLDVLQFRGRTASYLEPPSGEASFNLLKMARGNLSLELGAAIREAKGKHVVVRRPAVRLGEGRRAREINLEVMPIKMPGSNDACFLVLFEEAAVSGQVKLPAVAIPEPTSAEDRERELDQLRRDLSAAKEYLQSIIEQQDASNEELKSANEEILSSNEELQSTNEELETAKEELQSSNEELTTVNEELHTRNQEIGHINNDLLNLLGSVGIPIIMLGTDLHIRRFNPAAGKVMGLLPTDLGRPMSDMNTLIMNVHDLERMITDVIGEVVVKEREVFDRNGRWRALRIHPYRTANNKIDGVVLTVIDIDDAKRLQEHIRQSGEFQQAIVETVSIPLLTLGSDLRVQTATQAFYETFQVRPQDTEGRLIYELGNGQWNIPKLRTLLEELLPQHSVLADFEVEHEFERLGRRTMLVNARMLQQQQQQQQQQQLPPHILLAIEDITERRKAEAISRFQHEAGRVLALSLDYNETLAGLTRLAVPTFADWAFTDMLEEDGIIRRVEVAYADPAHSELARRVKTFPPDQRWMEHPPAKALFRGEAVLITDVTDEMIRKAAQNHEHERAMREIKMKSLIAVPLIAREHTIGVLTLLAAESGRRYDSDDLAIAEELARRAALAMDHARLFKQARESAERFRFMAESLPQKIFTAQPNGDVDYFNQQWMEFTGLTFEQIKDWGWTQFIHPDDVEQNVARWRHSLNTGEPFYFQHRFRRADGVYRWHISRAYPQRDGAGAIMMWIGSNTDFDDEKRAEEQLLDADRRKDEFIGMLAHELRNPLAAISNAAEALELLGSAEPRAVRLSTIISTRTHQLARMVDDLLDISRITQGKITLKKERVDVKKIVGQAVESVRPLIESRGHVITVSLPSTTLLLEGDATRLEQVVVNLLSNAAKYTDPGGRIRVTATSEETAEGESAVIRVRDTGIGIDPDILSRVFDIFVQAEPGGAQSQGGLGIGLSLVRSLVELHDGTVEAHSAGPGEGSEFVVRLPLLVAAPAHVVGDAPASEPKPAPIGPRRILVVEDNRDTADSLRMLLELAGHEVRVAHDGPGAIETAEAFRPEVMVTDIGLPGMDGCEVARRLRRKPHFKDLVLVALTGWGQEQDRRRCLEAGFDHHFTKPSGLRELRTWLAGRGGGAASEEL